MKNTSIEWADHTFNPVIGCEPVSEGCRNCYAAALNARFKSKGLAEWRGTGSARRAVFNGTVKRTSASYWKQPLAWNAKPWICDGCGTAHARNDASTSVCCPDRSLHRARVFCASMADWLHDAVPVKWLADLLDLIRRTPNLDWLLLTKRPENFERRLVAAMESVTGNLDLESWIYAWIGQRKNPVLVERAPNPPRNVWIGTSVEDQAAADARIPALLKIPAKVRFLSCEPLLGAVDLHLSNSSEDVLWRRRNGGAYERQFLHWVIAGGESGARARPMHPDWPRGLRDQCQAAGVAFLFKQWGEWGIHSEFDAGCVSSFESSPRCYVFRGTIKEPTTFMERVGKKAAGRLLDGREWNEFPTDNVANVVAGKSGQEDSDLRASAPLREASEIPEVGNG